MWKTIWFSFCYWSVTIIVFSLNWAYMIIFHIRVYRIWGKMSYHARMCWDSLALMWLSGWPSTLVHLLAVHFTSNPVFPSYSVIASGWQRLLNSLCLLQYFGHQSSRPLELMNGASTLSNSVRAALTITSASSTFRHPCDVKHLLFALLMLKLPEPWKRHLILRLAWCASSGVMTQSIRSLPTS